MNTASDTRVWQHWLIVCLIPLLTIAYFSVNPAQTPSKHLLNGIILACECTFLFKYVLFKVLAAHLKKQTALKKRLQWLFIPLVLSIAYTCHYFGLF
ncbi:MAG: hypothetical protein Q4A84_02280 [Neisseria sp.]|uniref:hypothetical protein n=1 Tax=Neisseria sp. TaxID=192066 RepID=UPI0026DB8685|nr:hypothetical protein [Neisseria sp.]MDO4640519.1 hypothetical protein [Neisseria sp.]